MVRKETCPRCNGNKVVPVTTSDGRSKHAQCPSCGGNGYQVRITLQAK